MFVATLRIHGRNFDVDAFLVQHPELQPDSVWKEGTKRSSKRMHADSGFNLLLAETTDAEALVRQTIVSMNAHQAIIRIASGLNLNKVIDFGLSLDVGERVTRSLFISSASLNAFAAVGIDVNVSVYAALEDDS